VEKLPICTRCAYIAQTEPNKARTSYYGLLIGICIRIHTIRRSQRYHFNELKWPLTTVSVARSRRYS